MEYRDALLERFERMAKPSNEIKTIVKYREIPSIFAAVNGQPEDRTVGEHLAIYPSAILPPRRTKRKRFRIESCRNEYRGDKNLFVIERENEYL